MNIQIDPALKDICPQLQLGIIQADVQVGDHSPDLWADIDAFVSGFDLETKDIASHPSIAAARKCYRALGKDPTRYRLSSDSLFRRIAKNQGLYQVNTVVDINNLLSLQSGHSIGAYDVSKIQGDILMRPGLEGEPYEGIGRGLLNIAGLPVLVDDQGPFGSATSDSPRTMVTNQTQKLMLNIISFNGDGQLMAWLERAQYLLETFANGENTRIFVVD